MRARQFMTAMAVAAALIAAQAARAETTTKPADAPKDAEPKTQPATAKAEPKTQPAPKDAEPATQPAPTTAPKTGAFIPLLPDLPGPGDANKPPAIPPVAPAPKEPNTPKPPAGIFIKPVPEVGEDPATRPDETPATGPATQPAQAASATQSAEPTRTVGFSPWVKPSAEARCLDLDSLPDDVRAFWRSSSTATGRALAERAAKDAARKALAAHFDEMQIAPDLTVRQLIGSTDEPNAPSTTFLRGAVVRAVRYHVDSPTVEVEMEIHPRRFIASLKGWALAHGAPRARLARLEKLLLTADNQPVRRTGGGSPPAKP